MIRQMSDKNLDIDGILDDKNDDLDDISFKDQKNQALTRSMNCWLRLKRIKFPTRSAKRRQNFPLNLPMQLSMRRRISRKLMHLR